MHFLRRCLLLYLIVITLFASIQRRLMYPASQAAELPAAAFPQLEQAFAFATDIELRTPDGVTVRGWHLQAAEEPSEKVVLLFHGNGGHRAHRGNWYTIARSLNADVLAIDYHGYGDSAGSPSEATLRMDAECAWEYAVQELKYQPEQIVILGESLGGGVGVRLAATMCQRGTPPGALVLVATFSSMLEVASYHFPWLPVRFLLLDRYRSDEAIPVVTCPILQFHGDQDTIVPLTFAERLHAVTPQESTSGVAKTFHVLPGAGHNDILERYGRFIRDELEKSVIPGHR